MEPNKKVMIAGNKLSVRNLLSVATMLAGNVSLPLAAPGRGPREEKVVDSHEIARLALIGAKISPAAMQETMRKVNDAVDLQLERRSASSHSKGLVASLMQREANKYVRTRQVARRQRLLDVFEAMPAMEVMEISPTRSISVPISRQRRRAMALASVRKFRK